MFVNYKKYLVLKYLALHSADKKWIDQCISPEKLSALKLLAEELGPRNVEDYRAVIDNVGAKHYSAGDLREAAYWSDYLTKLNHMTEGNTQRLSSLKAFIAERTRANQK